MANTQPTAYWRAVTGLNNDTTGRRFEPGESVFPGDFPPGIIEEWTAQGVLAPVFTETATDAGDGPQEIVNGG